MTEKELKEVSYYHNSVRAWVMSSLSKDLLIALFSTAGVFVQFNQESSLIGKSCCTFFVLCVVLTAFIFSKNMEYVEKILNGEQPKSIGYLDRMNFIFFVLGMFFLIISLWVF